MKPILFTMLLIGTVATLAANTVQAQATKLPDDVRRALPTTPSAAPKPVPTTAPPAPELIAEPDSADELLKQALLRYQNIALQSDGLTEQFLKQLKQRIERLETRLAADLPQQPAATATPAPADQPVSKPQAHVALRPASPPAPAADSQPPVPTANKVTGTRPLPQTTTPVHPARSTAMPVDQATPAPNVVAPMGALGFDDIADVLDATADHYERLANHFRGCADNLRKWGHVEKANLNK